MHDDLVIVPIVFGFFAWLAWMLFSTIRRYKIAKLQAEVQNRLLDKVGSGQELLAYAQSETGSELLRSLRVERVSPHGKIIGALQTGIVFFSFGIGLLLIRSHVAGSNEGPTVLGLLSMALGGESPRLGRSPKG